MNKILLAFLLLFIKQSVCAQLYDVQGIGFPQNSSDLSIENLKKEIQSAAGDTSKVSKQLMLCGAYWNRGAKNDLDSIIIMASNSRKLSESLGFTIGVHQSNFILFRAYIDKNKMSQAMFLLNSAVGEQKMRFLLSLGEHYMYSADLGNENLALAFVQLNKAYHLSLQYKEPMWRNAILKTLGKCYFTDQQYEKGKSSFLLAAGNLRRFNDVRGEAEIWAELGRYTPNNDAYYIDRVNAFNKSISLYHQLNLKHEEAYTLEDMAQMTLEQRHFKEGEILTLKVISLLKAQSVKKLSTPFLFMAEANFGLGNYERSLFYVLEALKNMELTGSKKRQGQAYLYLGDIYKALNDHINSEKYYRLTYLTGGSYEGYQVITLRNIAEQMIFNGKAREAISYLKENIKSAEPLHEDEESIYASALGDCFLALKRYDDAEMAYQKMILYDKKAQASEKGNNRYILNVKGSESHYKIAYFYFLRKNFGASKKFVEESLSFKNYTPVMLQDIRLLQFRLDSAAGDNLRALLHFRMYTNIKDSLFNIAKTNQMSDLRIKYDSDQKEKNLVLFKQREVISRQELHQRAESQKFRLIIIGLLLVAIGIGYSRYRLKQRANEQLKEKQRNISDQNTSLQQLLNKLQHLLTEKEWLLKEVHHRVKNNLQLVISLLNSQTAYLHDDAALLAVTESQNRVQAMSLIHQRLYRSNDVTSIYMPEYIRDLTDHLKASYKTGHSIYFRLEVDSIDLDVGQAIPLTLIMNEVISNAIKHAFPFSKEDQITVELGEIEDDLIKMKISDNGKGFPPNHDTNANKSFGLTLIKGLADELYSDLSIDTEESTSVSVIFRRIQRNQSES
jgi:two-component sensor histidine kinase